MMGQTGAHFIPGTKQFNHVGFSSNGLKVYGAPKLELDSKERISSAQCHKNHTRENTPMKNATDFTHVKYVALFTRIITNIGVYNIDYLYQKN